jgi:hypothetical protein
VLISPKEHLNVLHTEELTWFAEEGSLRPTIQVLKPLMMETLQLNLHSVVNLERTSKKPSMVMMDERNLPWPPLSKQNALLNGSMSEIFTQIEA